MKRLRILLFGTLLSSMYLSSFSQNLQAVVFKRDISCNGNMDGVAWVTVSGGTAPYCFQWSNQKGNQAATPDILPSGTYTCTIKDNRGDSLIKTIRIDEPDKIISSFSTHSSTCSSNSGEATVFATGGTGSKNFYWTHNSSTASTISGIASGNYTVLVRDSNGCSLFSNVQVEDENGPQISLIGAKPAACFGGSDINGGMIEISVSAGHPPYQYEWAGRESDHSHIISNIKAGIYSVKVTDLHGCISFDSISVDQPDTFKVSVSVTNTNCNASQGEALAVVQGGTAPYSYSWSTTNSTANRIYNLNSGIGNVIVTDVEGCTKSSSYEIIDIDGMNVSCTVISNAICFPFLGGSAMVNVSNGTSPYAYSWYPQGGYNDTAYNLPPDNYTVTIIDGNGCRKNVSITITSPDELKSYIYSTSPATDTSSDGAAYSIVYGGTPPYTYKWFSGPTTKNILNLALGTEKLVVTDSHGCKAENEITLHLNSSCFPGSHTVQHYCGPFNNFCQACTTYVERNIVLDFGASGDGITDDECAFEAASDFFAQIGPTVPKKLIIPAGTYIVGSQDQPWQLAGNDVLFFDNMENLTIEGEVIWTYVDGEPVGPPEISKLKFNNCLKYGAFDLPFNPDHRLLSCDDIPPCDPGGGLSGLYCRIMTPGNMIHISNCKNVTINSLELDGNIDNIVVGGRFTEGIQISYDGIFVNASENVTINNVNVHHFGHDGMVIYYNVCPPEILLDYVLYEGPLMNMTINDSKFNNNCRTGLVWGGGRGLQVNNCEFNYTGQGRFFSKFGAGMDIEYEASNVGNKNGTFNNCRFKYNKITGMICDAGGPAHRPQYDFFSRNFTFNYCTFVGSETGTTAWPNSRNFEFRFCNFYGRTWKAFNSPIPGSTFNNDNTRFISCNFSEEYTDPDIFPLTKKSISVGHDLDQGTTNISPGCPNFDHAWCVEFTVAMRVLMQDCNIETNFNLKTLNLSADVVPPLWPATNKPSWNIVDNVSIRSYGLNACGCNQPGIGCEAITLNSLNFVLLKNADSHQQDWGVIRNPGAFCTGPNYICTGTSGYRYANNSAISEPITANIYFWNCLSWGSNCFLQEIEQTTWHPLSKEYYNPIDPNPVNLYPDPTDCNVTTRFTTVGVPFHEICNPPILRKGKKTLKITESEISFNPNPATNNLNIKNASIGNEIKIYSVLGELIYTQKITESSFNIELLKFKPGVFIIRTENPNSYKFIKL